MNEESYSQLITHLPSEPGFMGNDPLIDYGVLIPFVLINGIYHILFQKRAENIRQGGEIGFPGGRVDSLENEGSRDAVVRETVEELGLSSDRIHIDGQIDTFVPGFTSLIHVYIGRLDIFSLDDLKINREEVAEIFTIPVSFFQSSNPELIPLRMTITPHREDGDGKARMENLLKEMGVADRYSREWEYSSVIRVWRYEKRIIWGLTADILLRLMYYITAK